MGKKPGWGGLKEQSVMVHNLPQLRKSGLLLISMSESKATGNGEGSWILILRVHIPPTVLQRTSPLKVQSDSSVSIFTAKS